jgi:hypothetical protein
MNDTINKIASLIAEEQGTWQGVSLLQTMVDLDNYSEEELAKLGWCFALQRDSSTGQNVLMWGKVNAEQNFIEESRFESKVKQEFEAICKEAMRRPL